MQSHRIENPEIHVLIENGIPPNTPGLVIASGPSLPELDHLQMLHESAFYQEHKGVIVTTAHSLKWCLDAGVVPDYVTMIDIHPKMLDFIDHAIVDEFSDSITGVFSLEIDQVVLDRWKGEKIFYILGNPSPSRPHQNTLITLSRLFPSMNVLDCMDNCGSFSWNVLRYIGCNPIALIGMDFAFKPDFPVRATPYYKGLLPLYENEDEIFKNCYRSHTHSFFGTDSYTDNVHNDFMKNTVRHFKYYQELTGLKTINCTGGGIIDDPDVPNQHLHDWLVQWE